MAAGRYVRRVSRYATLASFRPCACARSPPLLRRRHDAHRRGSAAGPLLLRRGEARRRGLAAGHPAPPSPRSRARAPSPPRLGPRRWGAKEETAAERFGERAAVGASGGGEIHRLRRAHPRRTPPATAGVLSNSGGHIRGELDRALQPASRLTQAEMADASKQNDEADVEKVHIPPAPAATGKGKSNKVVTRIKLSNFNPDEDVNIVKSWLEINCDPIISNVGFAQKKDRVWDRIMHRYNLRRGSYPERSLRSLQSRWDTIKAEVKTFSSFYADAIRENPGMSDADKTTHAAANFAGILKHNFAYMHCWEIMKDEPKWHDPKPRPFAKSAGGEGFGEDSSHGPDTNDFGEHNSSPTGHAEEWPMGWDFAEMADASKQNDEADVEEVHIPPAPAATGKGKSNKVVTRTKLSNFKPDEDVNLVKSWLEISCDPITSTAQKKDRVWDRIMHRYNLRRGSYPERSVRSLQSRWDTIKAEVKKFSSFYADAIRDPSRMSDADTTTHAAANFAVILKQNFAYIHCWEIMKDEPKWQDPKPFAESAGGEGFGEDSRHGPDTNDFGEHNSNPTGHAEKRPMGRDSAEMADASKQNDEADVEEVHIPPAPAATGKGKSNKVVTRIKLSNFKPDEDVNIVKSWLEINCDPITSTAQKKHRMWDRIMHRYNLRRGSYPERSLKSIQNRWDIIKAEVGKFSSFYADAIRENPSGMPDADRTTHAAANFAGILKRYFAYMHCWEIMKDEPKWQDPKPRPFAKSAGGEGFGEDSNNGPDTNVAMMHPSANGPLVFQQAEIAYASKQNDEVDVEEVHILPAPAATGKGKSNKVVTRTKLSNFNPDEDVNIVKSWLEISCDPITSTVQKEDRMWDRIMHRYNLRRGSYPERSLRSLQSRWDIIKAEVRQFSFLYADAIRENPSGMSDADKTTHAAANFASILKHNFAYMHCWEIMKDDPKWQDPKPRPFAKSAGGEGFGEDSSHGPDTNDLGEHNSSPTGHAEKRPMSRDSAKVAKKTKNCSAGSTSSAEYASRMQDVPLQKNSILQEESARKNDRFQQLACVDEKWFEEMRRHNQSLLDIEQGKIHIEQEKIRMMREKHDMDRQEKEKQEDERILGIDLNACTPAQRMYYEALQEEIFEKIAARRRKRQGP